MVEKRWSEIVLQINALGAFSPPLSVQQVKKKWADLKLLSKRAVARWNAEVKRTGGGTNAVPKPSETQFRIAAFIGWVNTEGIAATDNCDVAGQSKSSNLSEPIPPTVGQPSAMAIVERYLNNSPASLVEVLQYNTGPQSAPCELVACNDVSPTGAQSSNPCKKNGPLLDSNVMTISWKLNCRSAAMFVKYEKNREKAYESLHQLTQEIKRSNEIQNQVVEWLRSLAQHYSSTSSNVWSG